MPSNSSKSKAKESALTDQEIQQTYVRMQNDLQALATKIGELEQEADEHGLVLSTLNDAVGKDPSRKCFRLVGGILVERTVKDVVPLLQTNRDGIRKVIANLTEQYEGKEKDFDALKKEYNIRPIGA